MSVTTLNDLTNAWNKQKMAITKRTHAAAGYPDKERWRKIVMAHTRRVMRRDMGKCGRNRSSRVAGALEHNDFWGAMIRANRKHSELPEVIQIFGNSGKAKSQREVISEAANNPKGF